MVVQEQTRCVLGAAVSRERRLLFSRLRTFAALVFVVYLVVAHIGLAGVMIYSWTVVDGLAEEYPSPLAVFTDW